MAGNNAPKGLKLEEKIMALQRIESTEEQTQQEQSRQASLHKSVADTLKGDKIQDAILKDLGLSPEPEVKKPVKEVKEEEPEEKEETEESTEEQQEETQEEESEDEEVIPKSKVQKRFDELTARLKLQEKQLEELRTSKAEPKDAVTKHLEGLNPTELKAAKLEVRKAQIKNSADDAKLDELIALEEKIDKIMQEGPTNFANAQKAAYVKKAAEIAESGEIPNVEKAGPQIQKLAGEIYAKYPALQKDINGQATALELAVEHFKAINSAPGDKTKETELKRQVNTLKRKTTLDTKSGKINPDKSKLDSLRKDAMGGTLQQKVNLVKSHPMFNVDKMIPDEFKQ